VLVGSPGPSRQPEYRIPAISRLLVAAGTMGDRRSAIAPTGRRDDARLRDMSNCLHTRRLLVMKAIESHMAQPAAVPLRLILILIKFSTGVGRRVSKSSSFAHCGSMVMRTIC